MVSNPKTTTEHPCNRSTPVQERGIFIWIRLCSHQQQVIIAKESTQGKTYINKKGELTENKRNHTVHIIIIIHKNIAQLYIILDLISGLCKRHWSSWWLAPVKVPKLYRVWAQGVITQPLPG